MTIVGLHDFVKGIHFSFTQVLFAGHVHWRSGVDNKFSFYSLRVDAGKHLFSESEKNVALTCSFNFNTLFASFHDASHLALATLYPLKTDPQILERWGYADEVHLGKFFQSKDFGLEFWYDVQ